LRLINKLWICVEGVFRAPIGEIGKQTSTITRKFFNNFWRQHFSGNAKQQMMLTAKKLSLLGVDDQKWIESNSFDDELHSTNQIRAQTLLYTDLKVEYHEEFVNAIYGFMVMRDDGLFDFIGTTFIENRNEDQIIRAINQTLNKELGTNSIKIESNNSTKTELNDTSGSTILYDMKISSNQFTQIEANFTEAENLNSFGIFRIPLAFCCENQKLHNYLNRFFVGYSQQRFAHISNENLVSIWNKFK